ncbi:MAG: hypothetical protein J6B81_01475 [Spirochaetaceae bacterium]|nr:hypothetical protein [Spirochaetaceae bacterium]
MEKSSTLGQAISNFETKFKRYIASDGNMTPKLQKNKSDSKYYSLDDKERYKKSVIENYKKFIAPFQVFGKSSAIADQLERDKTNLMAAFNLYKSVHELNQQFGSTETYIKSIDLETPLTHRDRYTKGGEFIYLQCWFIYECKQKELVPQLTQNEQNGIWRLSFVPEERKHVTAQDLEVEAIIQECFYPTHS